MITISRKTRAIRRARQGRLAWCCAFATVVVSAAAHAEPDAAASKHAEALFQEAKVLMSEGRLDEACPKLEQARSLDGGGGTVLALALCHERQGKLDAALDEFREALALARAANRKDRADLAAQHIADLEARARQTASNTPPDLQPSTEATESETKPNTPAAPPAAAEPAPQSLPKPAQESAPQTTPVAASPPQSSTRRSAAWVVGGAGIAAAAVGSYYGVRAFHLRNEAENACGGTHCVGESGARGVQLDHQSSTAGAVSTVGFAVAGAALAASAWLFFTSNPDAVQVGAAPELSGMSFVASGRF